MYGFLQFGFFSDINSNNGSTLALVNSTATATTSNIFAILEPINQQNDTVDDFTESTGSNGREENIGELVFTCMTRMIGK